jgi:thiamine-phosphate pyrophosphorylase
MELLEAVEQAIAGGAACVQYRNKASLVLERRAEAAGLGMLCRRHGVPFIINDLLALALEAGADGLHIGAEDIDYASARAALGEHAILGVSCYNSLERALRAQALGADYVAFGRFFASRTKPAAVTADTVLLQRAKARLSVPIVAIGGITPENGGPLLAAGADLLAAIDGLFGQADVRAAALRYARLFADPPQGASHDPIAGAV